MSAARAWRFTWLVVALSLIGQPVLGQETAGTSAQLAPVAADPSGNCMTGPVLAASLLYPYFEVDLGGGSLTTLIAVANSTQSPTLCRCTLWTDWAVPSVAFDIYLGGMDTVTINLRDVFNGSLPSTGDGANLSGFSYCGALPPYHANPVIDTADLPRLVAMHTGAVDAVTKKCAGEDHGDSTARGYITIDVVDECSGVESLDPVFTPANTDYPYFAEGAQVTGIATAQNRLRGDVFYVDDANNFAQASEAVAVWADPGRFADTDIYTFYGRYSTWDGRDERIPLPGGWDQRFLNGGPFADGASLIVWRDTGSDAAAPVTCEIGPSWRPLRASITAVDEDGNEVATVDEEILPLATQKVSVTSMDLPVAFGSLRIVTNGATQSWVQPSLSAFGRFSASFNGTPVRFLCTLTPKSGP